jgi:hypothetical protein
MSKEVSVLKFSIGFIRLTFDGPFSVRESMTLLALALVINVVLGVGLLSILTGLLLAGLTVGWTFTNIFWSLVILGYFVIVFNSKA